MLDDFKQKYPIISTVEVNQNNLSVSDLTEKAKNLINDFVTTEYELDTADYSDLSNIEVAFTETEDGLHTIQSAINLSCLIRPYCKVFFFTGNRIIGYAYIISALNLLT